MEKMKDIIYDISDIIISLMIIAVIFFVISWKLNESMPISYQAESSTLTQVAETESAPAESSDESASTDASDVPFIEDERPIEEDVIVIEPEEMETPPADPAPAATVVNFEVPSGSTGFAIAKLLKDQGFITDINAFISKVEEMGLGAKLRSGNFELKTDMSDEEIIKKLAGVRD